VVLQLRDKRIATACTVGENVAYRAFAHRNAADAVHQLAESGNTDHPERGEGDDHRLEVASVLQVGIHPLGKISADSQTALGADALQTVIPALLRDDAHIHHIPRIDDTEGNTAPFSKRALSTLRGKAAVDGVRGLLELQSRTPVAFLAPGLFLGGGGFPLVDRGWLWLVEEIGGGRLVAVGAVRQLILIARADILGPEKGL
jgi:hypothetical protein